MAYQCLIVGRYHVSRANKLTNISDVTKMGEGACSINRTERNCQGAFSCHFYVKYIFKGQGLVFGAVQTNTS